MPGFELIGDEERAALNALFDEGGVLFAHGFDGMRKHFHVREFEGAVAERLKCSHALAVTSGTAATKIALKSLGVGLGDEVITQAFNFIATIEAILETGATPVIANVNDTLNMDPDELSTLITDRTKAIIPVHMLGVPAEMNEIMAIARAHTIPVLEDVCEALGAEYNGQPLGGLGDVAAISFDFGKVITCGEGGMVLTNNPAIDKFAREYHDHGHENNPSLPRGRDTKSIHGFNYRITEMQAVVGKTQLSRLNTILTMNLERYEAFAEVFGNATPTRRIPTAGKPINDAFIMLIAEQSIRERVIKTLNDAGFGTKNLPDAMEWHCAAYWDHALESKQVEHAAATRDLLMTAVAVPIWLRKTPVEYAALGEMVRHAVHE